MTTLNKKIYSYINLGRGAYDMLHYHETLEKASNAIEVLVLEEKRELMMELLSKWAGVNVDAYHDACLCISVIDEQLNKLNPVN